MTKPVTYTQRLHAFKKATTWTVEPGGLRWEEQGDEAEAGFIAYDDVTSVRLRFEPSRAETRRVALHVYNPIDHPITNIDYNGPLNFELQQPEFREFVDAFHQGFPEDSAAVFHKGSTTGAYVGNFILSLGILLFLLFLAPLVSLTGIPGSTSIFRIVMIIIFLPILAKLLIVNKPAIYRPKDWPRDMLS